MLIFLLRQNEGMVSTYPFLQTVTKESCTSAFRAGKYSQQQHILQHFRAQYSEIKFSLGIINIPISSQRVCVS